MSSVLQNQGVLFSMGLHGSIRIHWKDARVGLGGLPTGRGGKRKWIRRRRRLVLGIRGKIKKKKIKNGGVSKRLRGVAPGRAPTWIVGRALVA